MLRIVVSMTTLPNRYSKLEKTLATIGKQTLLPDAIYLGIPPRATRLDRDYPPLSPELLAAASPIPITVVPLVKDYGPICKILGALIKESDPQTLIITLDDDIIYPANHLERMVEKASRYPEEVIATSGMILTSSRKQPFGIYYSICRNKFYSMKIPPEGRNVDIICGFSGVAYRRSFFPENNQEELLVLTDYDELFRNDDILLSAYMSKRGVSKRIFNGFLPISYAGKAEETDLSYHHLPMVKTMIKAINRCRDLQWFDDNSKEVSYDESFNGKTGLTIVWVILLLALIVSCWLVINSS